MKAVALAFAVVPAATAASAVSVSRATADWIRSQGTALNGEQHSIQIAYVKPLDATKGFTLVSAWTFDNDSAGGWIDLLILTGDVDSFVRRYGTGVRLATYGIVTKRFDGIVNADEDGVQLVDLTAWAVIKARVASPPTAATKIRTWTAADGRTMEAEYLSHNSVTVRIRRISDGQVFTYPIEQLSQADREWLAAQ